MNTLVCRTESENHVLIIDSTPKTGLVPQCVTRQPKSSTLSIFIVAIRGWVTLYVHVVEFWLDVSVCVYVCMYVYICIYLL